MEGTHGQDLASASSMGLLMEALGDIAYRYAFQTRPILQLEIGAQRIFEFLLERFVDAVVLEYHQLRRGVLSDKYLLNYIDETLLWLGDAIERNFSVWGYVFDLSQYNGMTYLTPVERNATSHAQAVEQLKRFIVERGAWLDAHIETLYQYCSDSKNVNLLAR